MERGDDRDAEDAVRPRMSPGGRSSTNLVHLLPGAGYETVLARHALRWAFGARQCTRMSLMNAEESDVQLLALN